MQIPLAQNLPRTASIPAQPAVALPRFQSAEPARQVTSNRPGAYADGKAARSRASQQNDETDDQGRDKASDRSATSSAYRGLLLDLLA